MSGCLDDKYLLTLSVQSGKENSGNISLKQALKIITRNSKLIFKSTNKNISEGWGK